MLRYFESEEGIVKLTEGFQDTFQRGGCTLDEFQEGLSLYVKHQKIAEPTVDLMFYTEEQWCGESLVTLIEKIASKAEFKGWGFRFSPEVHGFFSNPAVYGYRDGGYMFERFPGKEGSRDRTPIQFLTITIDN